MTKKPSLIGLKNMTITDCSIENLTPEQLKEGRRKKKERLLLATATPG